MINEENDLKVFLSCECNDPEHTAIVSVWDWDNGKPDFNISVQARNWRSFHQRIWAAVKYIFGADLVWDDVIVDRKSVNLLQEAIDHYNKILDKYNKLD